MDLHDFAEHTHAALTAHNQALRVVAWEALMEEGASALSPAERIALLRAATGYPDFAALPDEIRARLLCSQSLEVRLAAIRSLAPRPTRSPPSVSPTTESET